MSPKDGNLLSRMDHARPEPALKRVQLPNFEPAFVSPVRLRGFAMIDSAPELQSSMSTVIDATERDAL